MEPISEKIWKNLYCKHIVKQKQQDTMAEPSKKITKNTLAMGGPNGKTRRNFIWLCHILGCVISTAR